MKQPYLNFEQTCLIFCEILFYNQQSCELIIMNVSHKDESNRKLNYYSRTSPKSKKRQFYSNSPLFPLSQNKPKFTKSFHLSSVKLFANKSDHYYSIRQEQLVLSSGNSQILIQQESDNSILIEQHALQSDPSQEDQPVEEFIIDEIDRKHSNQQKTIKQKLIILPFRKENKLLKNNDIKIQDDQIQSKQYELNNTTINQRYQYLSKQQQTMRRQFTFGHQFVDNQLKDFSQKLTKRTDIEYCSITPISSLLKLNSEGDDIQEQSGNHYQQAYQYLPNGSEKSKLIIDMNLIEETESREQQLQNSEQYQSPKFQNPYMKKEVEDKWITSETYYKIQEQQQEQSCEESIITPSNSKNKLKRSNFSARPFGSSILLLNEVLAEIPQDLSPVYSQMHRKLILDQINVEQRLEKQQKCAKILKMLLALRRNSIVCQEYLTEEHKSETIQQISINKIIILSQIKEILARKS